MTSDAIVARASRISPVRRLWIIERRVTIAATPIATQIKKNSSRRQDARSSRTTIFRTKLMKPVRDPGPGPRRARDALSLSSLDLARDDPEVLEGSKGGTRDPEATHRRSTV